MLWHAPDASASPPSEAVDDRVTIVFPESATFSATLSGSSRITAVVLEYGSRQLTCGQVVGKAFPQFTPAPTVSVEWTWLDEARAWRSRVDGDILRLHWYRGDEEFAEALLRAARTGLEFNELHSGLRADGPIDVYVYANTIDLREAVLYEPTWTGGLAFPEHNIVILGISSADLDWGRRAIIHELTHVLVGHHTFTCLGVVPTWLNEGLAVYSEGELESFARAQLERAVRDDTLISVRALSGGFSEVTSRANLSYSQSYSLVRFLLEKHGQEKMSALLVSLRDGNSIDRALQQVYGFDVDGLEDEWRRAVGAAPRVASALATARPSPTMVPTFVPVSGLPLAITPTPPGVVVTPVGRPTQIAQGSGGPPLALTLVLLGFCVLLLLLLGVVALGVIVRGQGGRGGRDA